MLMEFLIKPPECKEKVPPLLVRSEWVKYIRYRPQAACTEIALAAPHQTAQVIKSIPDAHFADRERFLTRGLRKALFIVAEHTGENPFLFAVDAMRIVAIKAEPGRTEGLFTLSIDLDHLPPPETKDVGALVIGDMTWEEADAFQTGWRDYIFRRARDEGARRTTELIVASQSPH